MNKIVFILCAILFSMIVTAPDNSEPWKPEQLMAPEGLTDIMNN